MQNATFKGSQLSQQQARLWSFQQEQSPYLILCALRLQGRLVTEKLRYALQQVVDQHEILRTSFSRMPGMDVPLQVIASQAEIDWRECSLANQESASQQEKVQQLLQSMQQAGWGLEERSPLAATLVYLEEKEHILVLRLPAFCADGFSLPHMVNELAQTYAATLQAHTLEREEPLQYIDVVAWQNEILEEAGAEEHRAFWQRFDLSQVSRTQLPLTSDGITPTADNFRVQSLPMSLSSIAPLLRQRANALNISPAALLLSCWYMLLQRLTGQSELILGVAGDGRNYEELTTVLGPYIRFLPLQSHLEGKQTFAEYARQIQSSLTKIVEEQVYFSWDDADEAQHAYFPLQFEYGVWPQALDPALDLHITLWQRFCCSEPFALKLNVLQLGEEHFQADLQYHPGSFSPAHIERISHYLHVLLYNTLTELHAPLHTTTFLDISEQQHLLEQWRGPTRTFPQALLPDWIEQIAQRFPHLPAVRDAHGVLSYRQLCQQANQLAHLLLRLGVQRGDCVACCLPRQTETLVVLLGILKAGACLLPLDPQTPAQRLAFCLRHAQARLLLSTPEVLSRLPPHPSQGLSLQTLWHEFSALPDTPPALGLDGEEGAYVIYTSGSTGEPKGVLISHGSLHNYTHALLEVLGRQPGRHFALVSTLAADLGHSVLYGALASGGCLHLLSQETATSAQAFSAYQQEHRVDVLKIVPSHLAALLSSGAGSGLLPREQLLLGGEVVPPGLLAQIRATGVPCWVYNHYGPTETTVGVLLHDLGVLSQQPPEALPVGSVPLGRPFANTQVCVLDHFGHLVPVGVQGELYVAGAGLAQGYLHAPQQTEQRFVSLRLGAGPQKRYYRTGDLVRISEEGELLYEGRADGQVKLRGHRIEVGEIEQVLLASGEVSGCAVVLEEREGAEAALVAYVVARGGEGMDEQRLRGFVGERLPEVMVPGRMVVLSALPLTANGKLDRKRLAAISQQEKRERRGGVSGPRDAIEAALAEIWSTILAVKEVGREENFFALGGHSLLATRVIAQVHATLGVELPIASLFEHPSIASLARCVRKAWEGGQEQEMPPLEVQPRRQGMPLSFAQQRLWFLDQLDPGSLAYNKPIALRLQGQLHTKAFIDSLQEIVRRHESLRTYFGVHEEIPVQIIEPYASSVLYWQLVNLQSLPMQECERIVKHLIEDEARHPFNLSRLPLLRVHLLRLDREEHILLFNMHHIVSDAWSNDILVHELTTLYTAFVAGETSPLKELPIQYADYAAWQRQWLQGAVLDHQLAYWTQQLRDVPNLDLPTDYPRPAVQTFNGSQLDIMVPLDIYQQLKALSQSQGVTLFMTLLAAFQTLLARYSAQQDIAVGVPIANRQQAQLEGVIGFFTNTLVMRCDLSGDPSFLHLLQQVRQVALHAYAHQQVPFEKLVEVLQPERDLSHSPLFQVLFTLQNTPQSSARLPDVQVSPLSSSSETAKFDLTLFTLETPQGLLSQVEYNRDLFSAASIEGVLGHWQHLLCAIVQTPHLPLSRLTLLSAAEQEQVRRLGSGARVPVPEGGLQTLFEQQAARTPEAIALVCQGHALSYGALLGRARRFARRLQEEGVGLEEPVAVLAPRGLALFIGLLATLMAGGVYVPLDPSYPQERLRQMLKQSQPRLLLAQRDLLAHLDVGDTPWLLLSEAEEEGKEGEGEEEVLLPEVQSQNLAYVVYTSGSTGVPKGVAMPHGPLLNLLAWQERVLHLEKAARTLQSSASSFDVIFDETFATWKQGGSLYVLDEPSRRDGASLLAVVRREGIQRMFVPYTLLRQMALAWSAGGVVPRDLEDVLSTAEALQVDETVRAFFAAQPECRLHNEYGPSESHVVSGVQLSGAAGDWPVWPALGQALDNCHLVVLDGSLMLQPVGVPGELCIGGLPLARGYLHRGEVTAEKFVPDAWSQEPGARLYRTGDLARYQRDGQLVYLGRIDQQVKVRGYRIELGEIEAALKQYPGIRESVVLMRELTSGDQRLIACLVVEPASKLVLSDLRAYLRERLPDYMLPSSFMQVDTLPLTPSGKVNRRALLALNPENIEQSEGTTAARSPLEELIAGIWAEILGLKHVGIHENFFELGGHSLLATQVIARMRAVVQIELPLRSLFESPTVAALAKRVEQIVHSQQGLEEIPPLQPVSRTQNLPLSFAQQRIWFMDQLGPGSTAYTIPLLVHLRGALNHTALEQTLRELIQRQEALRTTFHMNGEQPVQVIQPAQNSYLLWVGLNGLEMGQRETEARKLVQQETRQPFDLTHGPLFRATLLCLNHDEYMLLLTMHHIISDGWSMEVLVDEITTLYDAFASGKPSPLPDLPLQYADFALWQRQWLQGEVLETQKRYWTQQLSGALPLDLPTDHPRPPVQRFRGAHLECLMPSILNEKLKQLSQREGVTQFMLLLAAFQVLLARYSGQTDISVGTAIANRTRTEIERLIGFFVNTLVLRVDLSGNPSFLEVLARVREVCLGAYAHQDVPFEKLVEVLQPERDLSRPPLFQIMFGLQQMVQMTQHRDLHGLEVSTFSNESGISKFDITLAMMDTEQGLRCAVEYNTDLFEAATMMRMMRNLQTLLEGIAARPEQRLSALPLLSQNDRELVLAGWKSLSGENLPPPGLLDLFEAQVVHTPDAMAVVYQDEHLSYDALNRRANQLAHYLQQRGVGPEVLVGLYLPRSVEMVISVLGILKAGGGYVPLDPTYPQERLNWMLADSQVSVLLSTQEHQEILSAFQGKLLCLERVWSLLEQQGEATPPRVLASTNTAYIIYTSGSTGEPKGVVVTHKGLGNLAQAQGDLCGVGIGSHVLQFASWSFDASVSELAMTIARGATLYLLPRERLLPGPDLLATLAYYAITVVTLPPSALAVLPTEPEVPSLRTLLVAGEACGRELLAAWAQERAVWNAYGPTEATVCANMGQWRGRAGKPDMGHALAHVQVYVLDSELEPVPVGVTGELYVGGVGLARGYRQRADLTAERFIPHPFSNIPGERLYRTGDLARYLEDGSLEYVGRVDRQVKVRGYRIELGEIEAVLREHEEVQECVVVVQEERGDSRLIAYVVKREMLEKSRLGSEWRLHLQERLPEYMVPAQMVTLEALPLLPTGKVDRQALRTLSRSEVEQFEEGVFVPHLQEDFEIARTPLEEMIAGIYCDMLDLEQIGIHENFFELGGHSLLATRLIARIYQDLHIEMPVQTIFEAPTVSKLAEHVEQLLRSEQKVMIPPLVRQVYQNTAPLSFAQQRLYFLDQLHPGSSAYTMPLAVVLQGPLNIAALYRSIKEVVQRHESLRTTFSGPVDQALQIIAPALPLELPVIDLRVITPDKRDVLAHHLVQAIAQSTFDLQRGPLVRVGLLRMAEQKHVFWLAMHHIISDGWSLDVFVREVVSCYEAFLQGKSSPLSPLLIQYSDFALWQRQWLQGSLLDALLTYWRQQLEGAEALNLPADRPRSSLQSNRGASYSFMLPTMLSQDLVALSYQEGVTMFMTLLTAFQILLARYTGREDIVVGTDIANRTRVETEALIGFFVNLLVLRTHVHKKSSFRALLKNARKTVLDAYLHQDLPFDVLIEHMRLPRQGGQTPLVNVLFVLQNAPVPSTPLPDVEVDLFGTEAVTSKFDLAIFLREGEHGLYGSVTYSADLFNANTITRMMKRFEVLLQSILSQPDDAIEALNIMTSSEKEEQQSTHRRKLKASKGEEISFQQ